MKKRRIAIVAFLLVASMVIGIGYANLSKNLTISSVATSSVSNENLHVYFLSDGITNVVHATAGVDDSRELANFDTMNQLKAPGDTATATFTIKNETIDLAAKVYLPTLTITMPTGHYTPTCVFVDAAGNELTATSQQKLLTEGEGESAKSYVLLQPTETVKVKISLTLSKTPEADIHAEFSYAINAKSTAVTPVE